MPHRDHPSVDANWSTQQLAEFLVAVAACRDEQAALACSVQWVAEALEAEVAAVVAGGAVVESIGFGRGKAPIATLCAVAEGNSTGQLILGGRTLRAIAVRIEDQDASLVVARCDEEGFQAVEVGLARAMARTLAMTLDTLRTLERERSLREEGERRAQENERLLVMLQERQTFLERLSRIQVSISRRAPLPEVLHAIVTGAQELLGDEIVALRVVDDEEPGYTNLAASTGVSRAMMPSVQRSRVTDGVGGRAILEDRLIMSADYPDDARAQRLLTETHLHTAMAAPVHENGRPIGSIVVATYAKERSYSETEREMLVAFAHHVSLALNDAKVVDQMRHLAYHDALTGLPNRALFFEHLERAVANAGRSGASLAVVYLDVDRFKTVNDSLGHHVGDGLLEAVSDRLRNSLRAADLAARLGGDEFAVLAENTTPDGASALAESLAVALRDPFEVDGHELSISVSVGVALDQGGRSSAEALLRNADLAMYRAKIDGMAHHLLYEPTMNPDVADRVQLEAGLRRALQRDEFVVHYQPIVTLATGDVVGVEALVRWQPDGGGLVPPAEFIPVAEEIGLIVPISRIVLRESMRQVGTWHGTAQRSVPINLAVNLSARHLHQVEVVSDILSAIEETGFDATCLTVEITETALMHDTSLVSARLHELHGHGVRIALDDFGTGYSSLAYLRNFPIDVVKIDRSFVNDVAHDSDGAKVARAIIELGRTLNLETVAEGIEEPQQVAELLRLGCELGQGYHFARPLPAREMTSYLRAQRSRRAAPAALAG